MEISDFSLFLFFLVALFFHFAGHIYVLVAISRLRPRPLAQSTVSVDSYPNLTFVIPTFNEEQYVEEKLKNALSLDYPHAKMRILLVDGGSHDFTLQRAYAIQNACLDRKLEIYHTDKPGKIGQLNLALAKTSESDRKSVV